MRLDSKPLQLDYIINVEKFQKIQDDIAKATGMAVIAIDLVGHPVTQHSQCSQFCSTVRQDANLSKFCEKCDSHGGLEAARNQDAYIYRCHFGIVDFALPIMVEGQYLGAIMAGQIRLEDEENGSLEMIIGNETSPKINDHPELRPYYDKLSVMSMEKIEAVSQMINHLVNYIVGEAVLKTSLYEINQELTGFTKDKIKKYESLQNATHLYYSENDEAFGKDLIATDAAPKVIEAYSNSLLKPALKFIDQNYQKKIYLEKMAYLCNISPSYFSKIFKRETGLTFSAYVNQIKLTEAKRLLETTQSPIINISLDLGFDDCGYFIKVFKKQEGETPAAYRKRLME